MFSVSLLIIRWRLNFFNLQFRFENLKLISIHKIDFTCISSMSSWLWIRIRYWLIKRLLSCDVSQWIYLRRTHRIMNRVCIVITHWWIGLLIRKFLGLCYFWIIDFHFLLKYSIHLVFIVWCSHNILWSVILDEFIIWGFFLKSLFVDILVLVEVTVCIDLYLNSLLFDLVGCIIRCSLFGFLRCAKAFRLKMMRTFRLEPLCNVWRWFWSVNFSIIQDFSIFDTDLRLETSFF